MLPLLWGVALGQQQYNPGMPAGGASMYHTGLGSRPMTSAFGLPTIHIPFGAQRGELYSPIQRIIPAEYAGNGFRGALRAGAKIWDGNDMVFSAWIPQVVCPLSPPGRRPATSSEGPCAVDERRSVRMDATSHSLPRPRRRWPARRTTSSRSGGSKSPSRSSSRSRCPHACGSAQRRAVTTAVPPPARPHRPPHASQLTPSSCRAACDTRRATWQDFRRRWKGRGSNPSPSNSRALDMRDLLTMHVLMP